MTLCLRTIFPLIILYLETNVSKGFSVKEHDFTGQNLLAKILGDVNGNNLVSKVLKMLYVTVHSLT